MLSMLHPLAVEDKRELRTGRPRETCTRLWLVAWGVSAAKEEGELPASESPTRHREASHI